MAVGELVVSIIGDMQGLSKTFSQVQTELDGVGSKISSVGQTMSSAGSAMTSGITVPLAAVSAGIGVTAGAASEFDTGMRRVATMLPGITNSGFSEISNQALTLSKDFGSSTTEMTDAMYQALSSGVPPDNIFTFMQDASKLAIGGATDVVTATDVLTNAVNSYGEANLSTAEASDILFQGTKFGKSTVEELASSLSNVVPVAASVGIGFDDVNASLATMTIQGTPTAQATTNLRSIIDELSDTSSNAAASFQSLSGQTFREFVASGGTVGGAVEVLRDGLGKTVPDLGKVEAAMNKMKDPTSALAQQFNAIAGESIQQMIAEGKDVTPVLNQMGIECGTTANNVGDFFSRIEAKTGVLQLATDDGNIYNESLKGMGEALGSTDAAFQTMSEGSGAALDRLKSNFEVLLIKIGDAFLPLLADTLIPAFSSLIDAIDLVIPVITVIAGAFNSLPGPLKLAILGFVAFVAALGPVLIIAGSIASGIGAIATLLGSGGALAGAFASISAVVSTVIGVFTTFGTAIVSLLGGPLTIIIALIAAFALAWSQNWFGIRDKTAVVITALKTAFEQFKTNLKTIWDLIVTIIKTDAGLIVSGLQGLYNGMVSAYNSIKTALSGLYSSMVTSWNNIKTSISQATAAIITTLQTWYTNLQACFTQVKTAIQGLITDWSAKWNSLKTTASNLANQIVSVLQTWYTNVQAKFTQVKTAASSILTSWTTHWNNFKSVTTSAASAISSALSTMYSYVQAKFTQIKTAASTILAAWKTHWNNFVSNTKTAASNITSALASMLSSVTTKFNNIKSAATTFLNTWKTHWTNFVSATKTAASNITSALASMLSSIKSKFDNIKSAASTFLNTWKTHWSNFVSATKTASGNVVSALSSMLSSVKSKFDSIISAASSLLSSWKSKWNEIVSSTKSAGSQLVSAISGLPGDIKALSSAFSTAGTAILNALYDSIVSGFKKVIKKAKDELTELKSYLPSSPAEQGPFSKLPNWDTVFVDPLSASIESIKSLSAPLENSLSGLKSPVDSSISSGLRNIQNVSNNTASSVTSGDTVINVGPVSLSNSVDLQALVTEINKISADQRRQRGVFL